MDQPIPFKGGLSLYPVLVKDYYTFYSSFGCLTLDKTVKNKLNDKGEVVKDKFGKIEKVPDVKGISMSNLEYLISKMEEDSEEGRIITNQVMQLFELVFKIKQGVFCPKCEKVITYEDLFKQVEETVKKYMEKMPEDLDEEDKSKALYLIRIKAIQEATFCKECQEKMRDVVSIKDNGGFKVLCIKNVEITPSDFDEIRAIIPRQNILDYNDDKYIDPDLKEELELKKKLQNKDYTSPTLEKQMVCVCTGTSYTIEELKEITMRKLSYLLRVVDRKLSYQIQMTAAMSGFVQMKEDPTHWIFGDQSYNIAKELTDAGEFTKRFERVT